MSAATPARNIRRLRALVASYGYLRSPKMGTIGDLFSSNSLIGRDAMKIELVYESRCPNHYRAKANLLAVMA